MILNFWKILLTKLESATFETKFESTHILCTGIPLPDKYASLPRTVRTPGFGWELPCMAGATAGHVAPVGIQARLPSSGPLVLSWWFVRNSKVITTVGMVLRPWQNNGRKNKLPTSTMVSWSRISGCHQGYVFQALMCGKSIKRSDVKLLNFSGMNSTDCYTRYIMVYGVFLLWIYKIDLGRICELIPDPQILVYYTAHCEIDMDVSENSGFPPNHPFFIGFSIIFTIPFVGFPPIFGKTPILRWSCGR